MLCQKLKKNRNIKSILHNAHSFFKSKITSHNIWPKHRKIRLNRKTVNFILSEKRDHFPVKQTIDKWC